MVWSAVSVTIKMNKNIKKYWKSEIELTDSSKVETLRNNEFVEKLPVDDILSDKNSLENSNTNRRDFLKYLGFSTSAAVLASCEGPVHKSVPYVIQPERIRPGISNYYATSMFDGYDCANILVKTREGRPIKIENNKLAKFHGSANARVHASILSMYDSARIQGPIHLGKDISWDDFDTKIIEKLDSLRFSNKPVVLMTNTIVSPTTSKIISSFTEKYPNVTHVEYDSISESSVLDAHEMMYGIRAIPYYEFDKAKYILSIGADFLGDWLGSNYDGDYAKGRIPVKIDGTASMSKHIQIESNMSVTGANADTRIPISSSLQKLFLAHLYKKVSNLNIQLPELDDKLSSNLNQIYDDLILYGNTSLVVCGIDDIHAQILTNSINDLIKSKCKSTSKVSLVRQGNNKKVIDLINKIYNQEISGLIISGVNPAYSLPNSKQFSESLEKLDFSVNISMKMDETSSKCQYVAASSHYLESWADFEFVNGEYSICQPTIKTLFDTRQPEECLLKWSNSSESIYDTLKENWTTNILNSNDSWNKAIHDGVYSLNKKVNFSNNSIDVVNSINALTKNKTKNFELFLYSKIGMGDGQRANNPWLQEFPDPISRVSWDNYLTVSKKDAEFLGLKNYNESNGALNSNYAKVILEDEEIKLPVIIQPGQAIGTVGISFGYGRTLGVKSEMKTGSNAFLLYKDFSKLQDVQIKPLYEIHEFACVQLHNTLMGRGDIVRETTLEVFNTKDKNYWNPIPVVSKDHIETPVNKREVDIWEEFDRSIGHHFNLSIDLNACTGCGACVIACHAENNVPVVGKREIRKSRDMHWLRIDRYYSSDVSFEDDNKNKDNINGISDSLTVFGQMEDPNENPQVVFQPVMCQHCNHAPCETVCPVAASSHGRQGQNHMAYNRCVGTRYCANNCPYKVRRFNWFLYNNNDEFDFNMNDDLGKMVLNPDVVVRSRGVMEKCSFCIQSTQAVILKAKNEGREVNKNEFNDVVACSAACSTGALKFGDINNKESEVYKRKKDERVYHLLEYVGTKPNVFYHTKVRNIDKSI